MRKSKVLVKINKGESENIFFQRYCERAAILKVDFVWKEFFDNLRENYWMDSRYASLIKYPVIGKIQKLIKDFGVDVDKVDSRGENLLLHAVKEISDYDCLNFSDIKWLVGNSKNPELTNNRGENVLFGLVKIISLPKEVNFFLDLCRSNKNLIFAQNNSGQNLLHKAMLYGKADVVLCLMELGLNPTISNDGTSLLDMFMFVQKSDVSEGLFKILIKDCRLVSGDEDSRSLLELCLTWWNAPDIKEHTKELAFGWLESICDSIINNDFAHEGKDVDKIYEIITDFAVNKNNLINKADESERLQVMLSSVKVSILARAASLGSNASAKEKNRTKI